MPDIEYTRPDGTKNRAYLASPTAAPRGNVVVVQEWWGLTDQIRRICDRLANEGYRAIAPDLYHGIVVPIGPQNADKANAEMSKLDFGAAVAQDIRGAAQHVAKDGGKTAVLGFCMGGALTLLSAAKVPELSSAVCFYGIPPAQALDPSTIRVPLLAHFAKKDDWCTPANVDALEAKLQQGHVPHELHRYDAQHAFMNEQRPEVHDPKNADLAWKRSIEFLRREVG